MKKFQPLSGPFRLEDLTKVRSYLNGFLAQRIDVLYEDKFLAEEIKRRIEKGRKIRSLLFLTTLNTLDPGFKANTAMDICLAIEMTHAASCLVDDILDGDEIRHGYRSSQAVLGTPVAALEAHFLSAEALNIVSQWPHVSELLVKTYRRITLGEMYDIFLVEPAKSWVHKGYSELVWQKTTALFEFSLETPAMGCCRWHFQARLRAIGRELGKFYQMSNDYYDMHRRNIKERHNADQSWRITFSLPLACYLKLHGAKNIRKELDKGILTYAEWMVFLEKIWTTDTEMLARKTTADTEQELLRLIKRSRLPADYRHQLVSLVELVQSEDFWYHPVTG